MKTFTDIATRARKLHAAGALPTRQWTLPLICDHLARAMTGSTGVLGPAPAHKTSPVYLQLAGRIIVLTFGFIPKGRASPSRVLPQADITWEDAIRNLEAAIALCEQKMKSGEPWMMHPMLGFGDAGRWQRFHLVHARHHFKCLRLPTGAMLER